MNNFPDLDDIILFLTGTGAVCAFVWSLYFMATTY